MTNTKTVGSIEAGGAKFIVAVQDIESDKIIATDRILTISREETFKAYAEFSKKGPVNVLGIATFGSVGVNPDSRTYGYILDTPKPGRSGVNFKGFFEKELNIPVYITTSVNGSCYGEYIVHGADNAKTYLYITIGTGISGSVIQEGRFIGRNYHPEVDHVMVVRAEGDDYKGGCPFHDACVEDMTADPSLEGRTGIPGEDLLRGHEVFSFLRYYITQMLYNTYMITRPDMMAIGGSILNEDDLVRIHRYFDSLSSNYVATPDLDELIVQPAAANNDSATLSDFELAKKLLK